jgi:protein ImuA
MSASPALLHDLRARLARIERGQGASHCPPLSLCAALDHHLPDGGLARGAIHDVLASDPGAAMGFCAVVLGRLGTSVLWIAPEADAVWPAGLQSLGLCISRLVLVRYRRPADGLWAMEEALRSPGVGGAVLQTSNLGLIAARRLQLAAEATGNIGLLLRPAQDARSPSNAVTRWQAASLPDPLAAPHWQLDLLRSRGGQPTPWHVACGPDGVLQARTP